MDAMNAVDTLSAGARHLLEGSQDTYASVFPLGTVRCWLSFLVCVVASSQLGGVFTFVGLPLITGYMFIGAMVGPEVLGLIQPQDLMPLGLVTQCALAFICFSAGAELYLPELRALFKQILWQTSLTAFVTFFLCTLAIVAAAPLLPFLNALRFHHCRGSVAAVAASIMVARSPASAIAIVKELRAKGAFTSAVLGMTVLGDLYVLVLFSVTTSIARTTCDNERFSIFTVLVTLGVMLLSIVIGWFVGRFLMLLMYFKSYVQRYLILPLGLSIFVFSHWLAIYTSRKYGHFAITLESLLICIVAGYVCTNNSGHRSRFILVLGKLGPYVFLPFFTLTGASLKLKVLAQSFGFASVIALVRAACIFIGSSLGGYASGVRPYKRKENLLIWMCLLTQAGVSLGLASEMSVLFPTFGPLFQSTLIAVILINQVVGPVLFRIAARAVGDAGKAAGSGEEWDEDADVPIALVVGLTPNALAVAGRLLSDHWAVTLVAASQAEADAASAEMKRFGQASRARHAHGPAHDAAHPPEMGADGDDAPLLDEHGHPMRKMEDGFTPLVLALDLSASGSAHAAASAHAPAAAASTAAAGATEDEMALLAAAARPMGTLETQLSGVLSTLDAKRLAACVYASGDDAENLRVAAAVRALVEAAPKKSPLRALRCMALLQSAASSAEFEKLHAMPVHTPTHAALLAAKLLTTRLAKPVEVFAAAGTAAERVKAVGAVMRSGITVSSAADVASASAASPRRAALMPDSPLLAAIKTNMPRSFAELMRGMKSMVEGEDAGAGDPAGLERREYLEALSSMHENTPVGEDALGAVSQRSRAAGLAEVALYGRQLETKEEEARRLQEEAEERAPE
jgi:Kef-type K+ transport system membrane component KefB